MVFDKLKIINGHKFLNTIILLFHKVYLWILKKFQKKLGYYIKFFQFSKLILESLRYFTYMTFKYIC